MKWLLPVLVAVSPLFGQADFSIEGDVVNYYARQPLAGVHVILQPQAPGVVPSFAGVSDAAGHFRFTGLPAGPYGLVAFRTGFLRVEQQVAIEKGASFAHVRVSLSPEAVIAGKVEDQDGWPVVNAGVQVGQFCLDPGWRECRMLASARTNDLGEYRIGNLEAGRYYVCAGPGPLAQWDDHYVPVYYPAAFSKEGAKGVDVSAGQEVRGINLRLVAVDGVRVRGHAPPPAAAPPAGDHWQPGTLTLQSAVPSSATFLPNAQIYSADGFFEIYPVPAGSYVLKVEYRIRQGPAFVAQQNLQVGKQNVDGLLLTPVPVAPLDLSGMVNYESNSRPTSYAFKITLRDTRGYAFDATPAQDGSFLFRGLMPGNYKVEVWPVYPKSGGPGYRPEVPYPKSIRFGRNEVPKSGIQLDAPATDVLQIDMSAARASLDGVIVDSAGNPAAGAYVYLDTPIAWHGYLYATADRTGAFHVPFVPTGEYRAFAFTRTVLADHLSVLDFLRPDEKESITVTVVEGANSVKLILPTTK